MKRRKRDGRLVVTLHSSVVEVLRQVMTQLADVVASPPAGDVTDRLFHRAYLDPTEETAEQEWQSLVHDDLVRTRLDAVAATIADLERGSPVANERIQIVLDEQSEPRWLTVLNDARLMLGTMLGVTEDEPLHLADDDPRATAAEIYALLSELQAALVDVLLDGLPDTDTDDGEAF